MPAVSFPVEPVQGFKTQVSTDGNVFSLGCAGTLDGKDPTTLLQPELLSLHDKLTSEKMARVMLDVTAVDYMNSSAIKCFMMWFIKAERAAAPYQIEILY